MIKYTWFFYADKCHFLTVVFNEPFTDFSFNDNATENATEEKILGLVIGKELNVKSHLKNISKRLTKNYQECQN